MMSHKANNHNEEEGSCCVSLEVLTRLIEPFKPEKIGAAQAWDEFYMACQAAGASHELLRAIHDIKESIEDAQGESNALH